MIHQFWRLSEGGDDNLGPAISGDGLVLGRTRLIEQRDGRYVVRERREIERLLCRAYEIDLAADRLMSGLATVAAALNGNDPCLARIAAVHLRIPDLPSYAARDQIEAEDTAIRSTQQELAAPRSPVQKASPDDPEHPGWPAGTPDGLGGKFRPKDDSAAALSQKIKNKIERRELRMNLTAGLHVGIEALANLIPGAELAADVAMLADLARTISEYRKLSIEAAVAFDFVQNAPYELQDLQVSSDYKEFSSYDAFVKGQSSSRFMSKYFRFSW